MQHLNIHTMRGKVRQNNGDEGDEHCWMVEHETQTWKHWMRFFIYSTLNMGQLGPLENILYLNARACGAFSRIIRLPTSIMCCTETHSLLLYWREENEEQNSSTQVMVVLSSSQIGYSCNMLHWNHQIVSETLITFTGGVADNLNLEMVKWSRL